MSYPTPPGHPYPSSGSGPLKVILILVGLGAAVVLLVGGCAAMVLFSGESADESLSLVESAPLPDGAVEYDRTVRDGTFEIGPEVRIAWHLGDDAPFEETCVSVLTALRADGWELSTREEYAPDSEPLPDDVSPLCAAAATDSLLVDATPADSDADSDEITMTVLVRPADEPGGTDLAYSADGT